MRDCEAMESKEDRLLGSVIANHLFLSQFELFRACLLTLSVRSPGLARDIYQTVIRKIWTLKGVVWSESVPSAAHMAWLCLQELHAMEEKLMDDDGTTKTEGRTEDDDPWGAAAAAASSSSSSSAVPAASGVPRFGDNQWQFYCRPVYDCIEFLLLVEFIKQDVVDNGKTIARDILGRPGTWDSDDAMTISISSVWIRGANFLIE